MRPSPSRRPAVAATLAALVLAAPGLAGCAAMEPPQVSATGVDTLVSPLTTLDARDWSTTLDHPDLALDAVRSFDDGSTLQVAAGSVQVGGVATTALVDTAADGSTTTRLVAQDVEGNVWWLGLESSADPASDWLAGEDGAQAGLLLPASPRRGDGWATAGAGQAGESVSTVIATDAQLTLLDGAYSGVLVIETVDADGDTERQYYEPSLGLLAFTDGGVVVGAVDVLGAATG
ncbi:hypothetical protein [Nocardioides sp. GY 10127]|uniref:hypothetical protein n=1 Tax=Nocardioides sp. GY 10127 TaxID=2569762 RepID=UPI0010A92DA1|nr:hypothetical protein [Nocardioides sp. GY 10127]TIC84308.1 hypothetical protein E8D37_05910 [Nocardioides sp. GY 10127]